MKPMHTKGFSLLELLITVTIIGILASVALPSYSNYVIKASREAAQAELLDLASVQEKIYLNSNAYTDDVTTAYNGNADTGGLGRSSGNTSDGKYDIDLDIVAPAQTFTLTATPIAGGKQEGDGCITINESGRRTWHKNNDNCDTALPAAW